MSEMDRVFFADGYRLAEAHLSEQINSANLLALTESVYQAIDGLLEAFIHRAVSDGEKVDCKMGCHYCCSQAVFTNPWETARISHFLFHHKSREDRAEYLSRASEKDRSTSSMSMEKILVFKKFCAFLENQVCTIYPARPMACRIYLSRSLKSCMKDYRYPEDTSSFPDLFDFPFHAGRMLNEGIAAWLRGQNIPVKEFLLETAIISAIRNNDFASEWLRGERCLPGRDFSPLELKMLEGRLK